MTKAYVYRAYDVAGFLLYVGSTIHPESRLSHHKHHAKWFPLCFRIDFERITYGVDMARNYEKQVILSEQPIFNAHKSVTLEMAQAALISAAHDCHIEPPACDPDRIPCPELGWSRLPKMKSSNSLTNWRKAGFKGWTPPMETTEEEGE